MNEDTKAEASVMDETSCEDGSNAKDTTKVVDKAAAIQATEVQIAKVSAEELPDYLNRIVNLIEKWQLRIMAIPMESPGGTTPGKDVEQRHSTGSWRPTPLAAVALESPMDSVARTRVTAHKHKRATSSPSLKDLLKDELEGAQLTPLPSPVAKPAPSVQLRAMSPVPMVDSLTNVTPSGVQGSDDAPLTPGTAPSTPLHGLLFGHEVQALEVTTFSSLCSESLFDCIPLRVLSKRCKTRCKRKHMNSAQ